MPRPAVIAFALSLAVASCAPLGERCAAGSTSLCECAGGGQGIRVCRASGYFGACRCGEEIPLDGGSEPPPGPLPDGGFVAPSGPRPAARNAASLAFHHATERTVLFGGSDGRGQFLADTWEWDGQRWERRF